MSEELILTKDETVTQPITNTGTGTAVNTADASNIVPFSPETTLVTAEDTTAPEGISDIHIASPEVPSASSGIPAAPSEVSATSEIPAASEIPATSGIPAAPSESPAARQAAPYAAPSEPAPVVPGPQPVSAKSSEIHRETADFSENPAGYTDRAAGFTDKAAEYTDKAAGFTSKTIKKAVSHVKTSSDDEFPDEDIPEKKRFHFKKEDKEFFRDKWILSRISDEHLMDYLTLEQRRNELQQEARDIKEKRILKAFELTAGLASIVAVIYLLRDNPSILVNILYIAGILAALWFWKNPREK